MSAKFIFVTGGVLSSLGKGLTAASIALLLERCGFKVAVIKLDPYLNIDPGTMSPYQHGEVYVTSDGAEADLDLGHYHRYTCAPITRHCTATSGQIYDDVIRRERRGEYLGNTVQVIPHITDEIKRRILFLAQAVEGQTPPDFVMIEIGGTVGDIESQPFLEAIRQMRSTLPHQCMNLHLTYVPFVKAAGELKTKPSQHSVQALRSLGLFPDMLLCRSEEPLPSEIRSKLASSCGVLLTCVVELADVVHSIYELPLRLREQLVHQMIFNHFEVTAPSKTIDLTDWEALIEVIKKPKYRVRIAIVGKYVEHSDAYKSVFESLVHAALHQESVVELVKVDAEELTSLEMVKEKLKTCDGCLIPGGFGLRGWEGMILAAQYCRTQKLPCLGICLGMQVIAVEFARHVAGLVSANSTEMDSATPEPIISLLSEQMHVKDLGGTMRLGAYECHLKPNSKAFAAYKKNVIQERHRHRYEFNNRYLDLLSSKGMQVTGTHPVNELCEIVEVDNHPWMVGVQFHPEFTSKPTDPHHLFFAFLTAALERHKSS